MRGKHLIAGILLDRIRITPADAGKTNSESELRPLLRITPADAGKTMGCGVAIKAEGDHPADAGKTLTQGH